jgi:hypothetical protein
MRDEKVFIITLDVNGPDLEVSHVLRRLADHPDVSNWWNHIPGVYLVKTSLGADQLGDLVKLSAGDANFLVAEVNLAQSEGWLPAPAWRWIRKREREANRTESAD